MSETPVLAPGRSGTTPRAFLIPCHQQAGASLEVSEFFTIGRDSQNQLNLDDPLVSPRHARIEKKHDGFVIRDLQSRNGTFLNGSRVNEAYLSCQDQIQLGETVFVFSDSGVGDYLLASKNESWNEQLRRLPNLARTSYSVLIVGPSGSGKEILARAIHQQSLRHCGPFVSINCSALSENLIESELFGHLKGSFTGATHDRKGAFEAARGGTLFLDEIGDLPLCLQPKLLRALENNEIRPVGSDRTIETDVRIVAATHQSLHLQVATGAFREDLYYRLNVCQINPPPLTERMEDFNDILYQFAKEMRVRFSFNAIEKLKGYSWPGNIRELKNTIARAAAYFAGKYIQPEDIDRLIQVGHLPTPRHQQKDNPIGTKGSIIKEIEREMIIRRLIFNKGNQRQTAEDLGLPKSTLHDRLKTYSIDIENLVRAE